MPKFGLFIIILTINSFYNSSMYLSQTDVNMTKMPSVINTAVEILLVSISLWLSFQKWWINLDKIFCMPATFRGVIYIKFEKDPVNISGTSIYTPIVNLGQAISHPQKWAKHPMFSPLVVLTFCGFKIPLKVHKA